MGARAAAAEGCRRPGRRHAAVLRGLQTAVGTAGNVAPDVHLAALSIEHGAELCSSDADFSRFPGVRWATIWADGRPGRPPCCSLSLVAHIDLLTERSHSRSGTRPLDAGAVWSASLHWVDRQRWLPFDHDDILRAGVEKARVRYARRSTAQGCCASRSAAGAPLPARGRARCSITPSGAARSRSSSRRTYEQRRTKTSSRPLPPQGLRALLRAPGRGVVSPRLRLMTSPQVMSRSAKPTGSLVAIPVRTGRSRWKTGHCRPC